jgi:hypothetical protein
MVLFGALDGFQAFRTREFLTQVAFVCRGKHATAPPSLARHNEFATFSSSRCAFCLVRFLANPDDFPMFFVDLIMEQFNFGIYARNFHIVFATLTQQNRSRIMLLYLGNGAVCQNGLAMCPVFLRHERGVQRRLGKFEVPFFAAFHTVGFVGCSGEICAHALFAR